MKPYVADSDFTLYHGDCLAVLRELEAGSVDCCVTSPPYFGLREYATDEWIDGDSGCDHDVARWEGPKQTQGAQSGHSAKRDRLDRTECSKCGATRSSNHQIGLEQTPDEYVANLVEIFAEVRRVLRNSGTAWVNLGDTYAGNRSYQVPDSKHKDVGNSRGMTVSRRRDNHEIPRSDTVLPGLKGKDLVGIPWRVAFALQADGWYLRTDIVWCLSGGATVYAKTQKGEMPMMIKDLVRLDPATVKLWNGEKWTQVLGWSQTTAPPDSIELVVRSGERVCCTPNHEWPTQRGNVRADQLNVGDTIQTTTLPEPSEAWSRGSSLHGGIPWFLGLYLAEGSRSGDTIQISGHASQIEDRVAALEILAAAYDGSVTYSIDGNKGDIRVYSRVLNAIIDQYIGDRTAKDKHLKVACWRRTNDWLRSLLDGYLAGDGHYEAVNNRWRIGFTRNYSLERDLRTLAARIGARLRLKPTFTNGFGKRWPTFRGELRFDADLDAQGEIIEIRRGRARQFWDIGVEDEPHLFALASGLLTHNSKTNCMPESVKDRPTRSHEYIFLLSKAPIYYFDQESLREPAEWARWGDQTTPKYAGTPTAGGWMEPKSKEELTANTDRNGRSVWTFPTESTSGTGEHTAAFPRELPRRCISAGCPPQVCLTCGEPQRRIVETTGGRDWRNDRMVEAGIPGELAGEGSLKRGRSKEGLNDTKARADLGWSDCGHGNYRPGNVLDPFLGSGTTAIVARELERHSVGIEMSASYCHLIAKRLAQQSLLA